MLVGGAIVFKRATNGRVNWFLVKEDDKNWEIPKTIVRKGESSVRSVLRMMGEQGGMNCRVLEEAGRVDDVFEVNGKKTPRRTIYYLMISKVGGEVLGFDNSIWVDFDEALKNLSLEKERVVLKQAKEEFDNWLSRQKK